MFLVAEQHIFFKLCRKKSRTRFIYLLFRKEFLTRFLLHCILSL